MNHANEVNYQKLEFHCPYYFFLRSSPERSNVVQESRDTCDLITYTYTRISDH